MPVYVIFLLLSGAALQAADKLDMYFIDVEAGNSTLIVGPSGRYFAREFEASIADVARAHGLPCRDSDLLDVEELG